MNYYINLNKQDSLNGSNYEIHKKNCFYCHPQKSNFHYLGYFASEDEALLKAKYIYKSILKDIDGCIYCCKSIHKI